MDIEIFALVWISVEYYSDYFSMFISHRNSSEFICSIYIHVIYILT